RVLEPGDAERARIEVERPPDALEQLQRRQPALLDPQPDVFALPARLVGGQLLDREVLGLDLVAAGDEPGGAAAWHGPRGLERRHSAFLPFFFFGGSGSTSTSSASGGGSGSGASATGCGLNAATGSRPVA